MNFDLLVQSIADVHRRMQARALKAVNVGLTLRNWLIGAYISEYELRGEDRADYGERLFTDLAGRLTAAGVTNCNRSRLYRYKDFFRLYPQIREALAPGSPLLPDSAGEIVATPSPQSSPGDLAVPSEKLLNHLSYSHIELLLEIDQPLKRAFYEIEAIKGGWSVRDLKRQIGALFFERSGLSKDPEALARQPEGLPECSRRSKTSGHPTDIHRNPEGCQNAA